MRELPMKPAQLTQIPIEPGPQPLSTAGLRRLLWGFIKYAPAFPNGGERIGEATSAVTPWPHQIRAFQRMYDNWPPNRIDRLGQENPIIRIVNRHYDDTVGTDVCRALRNGIGLFESVVGKLQPILSQLPQRISATVLTNTGRDRIVSDIESALDEAGTGLDLDAATDAGLELAPRPKPLYDFDDLDRVLTSESARPVGIHVSGMTRREYSYLAPGMSQPVRITTGPEFYEEHTESVELWSSGNPAFPMPEAVLRSG
ncbi:MAG: hypothetical protein ACRD3B_00180 [Candidatus Sulfotelmatobacter sp.]